MAADTVYKLSVPQSTGSDLIQRWDFDHPELPLDLLCTFGAWRPATNTGPDGSSCMETYSNMTMIAMDVQPELLPLEITYQHASRWTGKPGLIGTSWTWDNDEGSALLSGFSPIHFIDRPAKGQSFDKWHISRVLVTAEWIVTWDWGDTPQPTSILLLKSRPEGHLLWFIGGLQRVDNLTIRRARELQTPDLVKQCRESLDRIPADQRKTTSILPGMKSSTGGDITVRFMPKSPGSTN